MNPPAPLIDVQKLLIGKAEIDGLNSDVEVMLERFVVTWIEFIYDKHRVVRI